MVKQKSPDKLNNLRKKAKKLLAESGVKVSRTSCNGKIKELDQDLSVHQIELEMQNDELRKTREQLEESRARYFDLYKYAPVGYLTFDEKGVISELNLTAAHLLGKERSSLINKPFTSLIAPESQDVFYLHRRQVLQSASKQICELVLKRKKGGDPFFHAQLESILVRRNEAPVIRAILTDITERKRVEESARESDQRMARAQEIAHLGSWELDVVNNRLSWSDEVYRIFGLQPQEFGATYDAFLEAVHPDDRAAVDAAYSGSLREGRDTYEIEHRVIRRSTGEVRFVHEKCEHVRDLSGRIIRSVGMVHDITERRQMEEKLRASRDELEQRVREKTADVLRLAVAVDKSAEAIVITDSSWLVQYANPTFYQLTGYRSDEVIGREMIFLRSEEEDQSIYEMNRRAAIEGTPKPSRHVIKGKDGTVPVESLISAVRSDSGAITNFVFVWRDISEQLSLEERLRQAHKMEAIGTLAGGIAHDFNNMLAAIIGFTEMVLDDVADNKDVQHKMEQVLKAGFRGRDLVKQILAFSQKTAADRKEFSLTPLVKDTHALLRSSLPSTIEMPLVITTADDYVVANPTQLQQVLMNLATNAAHAMRESGGRLTIGISSVTFLHGSLPDPDMEPGTYVKLTVQDTGVGMTKEVRQRIFEPFFTTKGAGEGTGMGLAVVYGVIKDLEGTVTVQSEPGQGSIFEIFLPQVQRPDTREQEAATSVLPTGTERILFVDDEELLVEMGRGMLESLRYHVTVAANGREAWQLFHNDPSGFDLVITDQTMPELSGMKLAQKMLKLRKDIPVILCTGYSEMASAEKAEKVGIRAFVMKPMMKKDLAETVRRVLDGTMAGRSSLINYS